jgi:hypothetical protein
MTVDPEFAEAEPLGIARVEHLSPRAPEQQRDLVLVLGRDDVPELLR